MIELTVPQWWLKALGFSRGNPFSAKEADTEPLLESCFIDRTHFYEVLGTAAEPRTTFLVADRGCGKSTNRKMLEQQCREGELSEKVLVVPYLEFGLLLEKTIRQDRPVTVRAHVDEILKQAVIALLDKFKDTPAYAQALYSEGHKQFLKRLLLHYTDILSLAGLDHWLQRAGLLSRQINAQYLFDLANAETGRSKLEKSAGPHKLVLDLLIEMINQPPADLNPAELSPENLLSRFVQLVHWLGLEAVYIVVDRVDETAEIAADPELGATFLEPLVADLSLMQLPHAAFKFFLPLSLANALKKRPAVRLDRLLFREISWTVDDLVALLDRRVHVYSEGLLPNLDQLTADELSGVGRRLAEQSCGLPRYLLLLGEWLLYHYHHNMLDSNKDQRPITETDLQMALTSFQEGLKSQPLIRPPTSQPAAVTPKITSGLSIDEGGKVWRSGQRLEVKLSKLEDKTLRYFCENPGKLIARDELMSAVYGQKEAEKRFDSAIDAVVNRLRKKIEVDSENPRYIKTDRGRGFIFEP